jgi:hypothetical protein
VQTAGVFAGDVFRSFSKNSQSSNAMLARALVPRILLHNQVTTDPLTGQPKTKKTLGGAYPGQRRPAGTPYAPPASAFSNGQATVHFKAYGGGNALTLVQQDGSSNPASGIPVAKLPEYVQVTLPEGVTEGQTIHVQAPDGKVNAIVVPAGFGPGSTFTVEFAPDETPPPEKFTMSHYDGNAVAASATPAPASAGVDDFASGFGRTPVTANATTNFNGGSRYAHSGAQATPVYNNY